MENSIIVMDDIVPNWLQEQCEASLPHQPIKFGQKGFTQTRPDMNELPWELKALWCAISYRRHDIKAKIPLFGKAGFLTLLNVQANMYSIFNKEVTYEIALNAALQNVVDEINFEKYFNFKITYKKV